ESVPGLRHAAASQCEVGTGETPGSPRRDRRSFRGVFYHDATKPRGTRGPRRAIRLGRGRVLEVDLRRGRLLLHSCYLPLSGDFWSNRPGRPRGNKESSMEGLSPILALSGLLACGQVTPPPVPTDKVPLSARARDILRQHCHRCHGEAGAKKGGFDYVLDRTKLVQRGQVVPGARGESPLVHRVGAGEMPPAKEPRPSPEEVAALRQWVAQGASTWEPGPPDRRFLSDAAVAG